MKRPWPRHVRTRMTLWYVLALGFLLLIYAGGTSLFLFHSLREQLDANLVEDVETVEGLLVSTPDGRITLDTVHPERNEPDVQRLVEVWSPEGTLLYRSPLLGDRTLGGPPRPQESKDRDIGEPSPATLRLRDGARVRIATSIYTVETHRVLLRVAHSEEALWQEIQEFLAVLAVAFPLVLVLAGFGGFALARKSLAPVDAMAQKAEKISAEQLSERLPIENPEDELGQLAGAFNSTLARLEAAFEQLRRFTADASHELRTPLTAIRAVGEVGLQKDGDTWHYRDIIGSMLEESGRLTRLVDSLLTISRAETGHVQLNRTSFALLDAVREASGLVEVLAEEKGQHLTLEGDTRVMVYADRVILRQAIVNVIDNAVKYSSLGGAISVRVLSLIHI